MDVPLKKLKRYKKHPAGFYLLIIITLMGTLSCVPMIAKEPPAPPVPPGGVPANRTSVSPPTAAFVFPTLTRDTCPPVGKTICTAVDLECQYKESEQATLADDILTEHYLCTHTTRTPVPLIINTYTYSSSKMNRALLCDINAADTLIGFATCQNYFCVDKIELFQTAGFVCEHIQ